MTSPCAVPGFAVSTAEGQSVLLEGRSYIVSPKTSVVRHLTDWVARHSLKYGQQLRWPLSSGQIVVSASTAAIVDEVALNDLGEYRLRDLSQPQRLYQVKGDGLRETFPPLRTLDFLPGNLPAQATSFLGRDNELSEVAALLHDAWLVTFTGVGGVGKTRLAVQVAAEVSTGYRDGAWFVELAVQTHGLPASHCFWFSTATMSPAPPAAFTSRGDRWQARASCLTFPHAAGAMDKIQASTDRSVGRRHELVNRTNKNILYKRPMSRAFSAATILMGSNRAFTSLPAQTNRRRQPSRP